MNTPDSQFTPGTDEHDDYSALDVLLLRRSLKTIMKPAITVAIDTPASEAVSLMQAKRIGCVLVVANDRLTGIFTSRDVLKHVTEGRLDLTSTRISEVMTAPPQAANDDDTIAYALSLMHLGGYRHVPVVNNAFSPIGVVSVKDITSFFVVRLTDQSLNFPSRPVPPPVDEQPPVPDTDSLA